MTPRARDLFTTGPPGPECPPSSFVGYDHVSCSFNFEDVISQDAESCFLSPFSVAFSLCLFSLAAAGRLAFHLSSMCPAQSEGGRAVVGFRCLGRERISSHGAGLSKTWPL